MHAEETYIREMKQKMEEMREKEMKLEGQYTVLEEN